MNRALVPQPIEGERVDSEKKLRTNAYGLMKKR